jgi:serine/threonine protein kinase
MEEMHQPGDIIAKKYRIIDTLGQGGNGITYKAEDIKTGDRVALKALSFYHMTDWKQMELFDREAQTLANLNHPGIPKYLDYFQVDTPEDRGFYIVQQLVVGKSLAELVKNGWRSNEAGVRNIATQVLNILIYLQSLKPPVFHRDIKPQNLIGSQDGKVYLVDFGAVQNTYRNTFSFGSTVVGTFGYMAPEQFQGQALPATDLYGLAATLLFLLTHRSPADLPTDRLKISFRKRVQISEQFADWLEKMLEPDAEDRFVSAKAALAALQRPKLVFPKSRQSIPRKAAIAIAIVSITSFICLKFFKYPILDLVLPALGYPGYPMIFGSICNAASDGDIDNLRGYLWLGGRISDLWGCVKSERVAKFFLTKTTNLNAINAQGQTPLCALVSTSEVNENVIDLLIANGADVNASNKDWETPLHLAVSTYYGYSAADIEAKRQQIMGILIAKGAEIDAKDKDGNTPLHLTRDRKIAELLIAKGANFDAKNNEGESPLNMVMKNTNSEALIELLIIKGSDVNNLTKTDKYNRFDNSFETGASPLHFTIVNGQNRLSKLLVAKGANINVLNNKGVTPLDIARASGNIEMVKFLKSHGGKDSGLCTTYSYVNYGSNNNNYNTVMINCLEYSLVDVKVPK